MTYGRKNALAPLFTIGDLPHIVLYSPDALHCCSATASGEREFLLFVEEMVREAYPTRSYHVIRKNVFCGLRTHDMDDFGRFFIIDNLSHFKRVVHLIRVELYHALYT